MSNRCCEVCGKPLFRDEVGLSLKLYGTESKEAFCLPCLAVKMRCSVERLEEMIAHFKKMGCTLFH